MTAPKPRPYLPRERRKQALVATAAHIVETRGWNALTMVSLAEQSGVSRQLVYQHFESLQHVIGAALQYIFEDVFVRSRDEVVAHVGKDIKGTVASLQQITFDIPVGRARALWQAMTASGWGDAELSGVSRTVRRLLMRTTQPLFQLGMGLSAEQSAPLAWMMLMSFWGARQLVDDGELTRDDAMGLYSWLVDRILFATDGKPPAVTPPPRVEAPKLTVEKTRKTQSAAKKRAGSKTSPKKAGKAPKPAAKPSNAVPRPKPSPRARRKAG